MPLLETNNKRVILASKSPRRIELLKKILPNFEIQVSNIDETTEYTDPIDIVKEISKKKALKIFEQIDNGVIIAADSIVVQGKKILGKPKDKQQAFQMLNFLSGKIHKVYTGFIIIEKEGTYISDYEVTRVKFRPLRSWEIEKYIELEQPFDKAGSYGIQDSSAIFVEWIHGCYFNVVGLPLAKLYMRLLPLFNPEIKTSFDGGEGKNAKRITTIRKRTKRGETSTGNNTSNNS